MALLEESWEYREEVVYREMFGNLGEGIYTLDGEMFLEVFNQETYDPRWLFCGVFASPPNEGRNSWLYVSSGMSNPWEDDQPREFSGMGAEFVMETDEWGEWPIVILQRMVAFNILLAHGRLGEPRHLDYGDRIPLRGSIALDKPSELRNMVIDIPDHYPSSFNLPSGEVGLFHFIGITDAELAYAKQTSSEELIARLRESGVYPLTSRTRASII